MFLVPEDDSFRKQRRSAWGQMHVIKYSITLAQAQLGKEAVSKIGNSYVLLKKYI